MIWLRNNRMKAIVAAVFLLQQVSVRGVLAVEKPQETGGEIGSVDIKGEAKDKVTIQKVTPEIKIKISDIVDSVTNKTEQLLEKGKPIPSEEDLNQFNKLSSQQTAKPWLIDFSEPPLISFFPAIAEKTVKVWRLEVTDEQGNIIKTIHGKGNPVKQIEWDGYNDQQKIIRVAYNYSFRFITIDEFGNPHTTLGKAFSLTNLRYRDRKNIYLEISNQSFFDEDQVKPEEKEVFDRVIDILREYSQNPFTVEFYTDKPQGEQVRKRQQYITAEISRAMLLLPEDVRYVYDKIGARGDIIRFVINLKK